MRKNYSKEEQENIIQYLKRKLGKFVMYDEVDKVFMQGSIPGFWKDVPENEVDEVIDEINKDAEIFLLKRNEISNFLNKYGESVSYFFHKPLYDDEGIYVVENNKKKYFTLAELDSLLKEFKKRNK